LVTAFVCSVQAEGGRGASVRGAYVLHPFTHPYSLAQDGTPSFVIMRPSSLGGGRILRRTLSVCPSVPLLLPIVTSRHLANYNDMTHMYFWASAQGRISYGHLGRTNSCYLMLLLFRRYMHQFKRCAV